MKQLMYAVYDSKAKAFCRPFFAAVEAVALRAFEGGANDPENEIGRHPNDFSLFQVGEFDDDTGVVRPLEQHINFGLASQFRRA